ncbi:hypothetical protein CLCR_09275 [Cladophialophora carrionii]|uniref:Uncharacterized protein n=1 Tax=Cladophialophora carrionii TaxID=86049 RepID=A0A1C1CRD8_9EURO|nr:hypothetical protein CLCR_09275 [Cladophialophora carrionii]
MNAVANLCSVPLEVSRGHRKRRESDEQIVVRRDGRSVKRGSAVGPTAESISTCFGRAQCNNEEDFPKFVSDPKCAPKCNFHQVPSRGQATRRADEWKTQWEKRPAVPTATDGGLLWQGHENFLEA